MRRTRHEPLTRRLDHLWRRAVWVTAVPSSLYHSDPLFEGTYSLRPLFAMLWNAHKRGLWLAQNVNLPPRGMRRVGKCKAEGSEGVERPGCGICYAKRGVLTTGNGRI
jgi:hypothetical protein